MHEISNVMQHTILGAGGPVANALQKELSSSGDRIRLASRRAIHTTKSRTEWMSTNLLDRAQVLAAASGSDILYMCAGLRYDKKVWAAEWPVIMDNLIAAAKDSGARLIFFDNVYMYGRVQGAMTENSPYKPNSVKGAVRARIAEALQNELAKGTVRGSIARAADFYGSESLNSFLDSTVLAKYAAGKKAMWLSKPSTLHSFTYVPDAGAAMALLGSHPESDGQVWHLPTAPAMTGHQFLQMAAQVFGQNPKAMAVGKGMISFMGLFNKMMKETAEMWYQYDSDYVFSSAKFEKAFGMAPTAYEVGMREFAQVLRARAAQG